MGCSERQKEIKRRRHRRARVAHIKKRAAKATASEKAILAQKLRDLTPGGEELVASLGLENR